MRLFHAVLLVGSTFPFLLNCSAGGDSTGPGDGDGDTAGDGDASNNTLIDSNGDGTPDGIDNNGDGVIDVTGTGIDKDGDGVFEGLDTNGDGTIDISTGAPGGNGDGSGGSAVVATGGAGSTGGTAGTGGATGTGGAAGTGGTAGSTGGSSGVACTPGVGVEDVGSGSFLDKTTCLTWQKTDTHVGTITNRAALAHCTALTQDGLTWRLPTAQELRTYPSLPDSGNAYLAGPTYIPTSAPDEATGCTDNSHSCNLTQYSAGNFACGWQGPGAGAYPVLCVSGTATAGTLDAAFAVATCCSGSSSYKEADCSSY